MRWRRNLVVPILLAGVPVSPGSALHAQPAPVDPWEDVTADDLHFIRATLRTNHPGPADSLNPWFRSWYDRGFELALEMAARVRGYPGYYFTIQRYMQGFQDGHLGALGEDLLDDPRLAFQWPGVVLDYREGEFRVAASEDPRIPASAHLLSCDRRSPDELGRRILGAFHGLWSVRGARSELAPVLFVDAGNPFVARPERCVFLAGGSRVPVDLRWSSVGTEELRERIRSARPSVEGSFEVREFADGAGTWISLPSFATGVDSVAGGLDRVLEAIERDGRAIRRSELVVVDVRGNGGGSTSAGYDFVAALWGSGRLSRVRPKGIEVDWRVSEGNLRFLRRSNLPRVVERYGEDDPYAVGYRELVDGVEAALDRGETYYRETLGGEDAPGDGPVHPVEADVYFLTDSACFSACLGFADVMLRLPGVVHVGRETRADAVYIDNRAERLPSDLGWLGFSMKVYRNRPRGHNESYRPVHIYDGDMRDREALERWILELHSTAERRRP